MAMTTRTRKQLRALRQQRLALALITALTCVTPMVMAQNLPQSGTVSSGAASIGTAGNQMTITQTTQGAIIDWSSFNVGSGYTVMFDQQFGSSSVTLNRDSGASPSYIYGNINANGNVFIINPAGITFGSGAQVNVGGLVASTLAISNADFLSGVTTGHYRFLASGGYAGDVQNDGVLTAANGGTIGLIGSHIGNAGTITANAGSVVLGSAESVTLDYFGDGLTQVTLSGNGLFNSFCSLNCAGGITSSGKIYAAGGHIEMRTTTTDGQPAGNALFVDPANGGRIWISGVVAARTVGTRRGSIVLDAGMGNLDLGGVSGQTGLVSVAGIDANETAGTIQVKANQLFTYLCVWTGNQCVNNNELGMLDATGYGTGGNGGEIHIDAGRIYHAGWFQAGAVSGTGGLIDIKANSAELYSIVSVESSAGAGGTISITADNLLLHRGQTPWLGGPGTNYSLATLAAFGTTQGGNVNIDATNFSMVDLGNVAPADVNLDDVYRPTISVDGFAGNGGNININTTSFSLTPWQYFEATGTGVGGSIKINADSINLEGGLVATGGTSGGSVETTATSSLFAQATAYIKAGTWSVHAPQVAIVAASGATPGSGAVLTDAALSASLESGTDIHVLADAALVSGGSGNIHIDSGVAISHTTATAAALQLAATAGIYGGDFSIISTGGALDLQFVGNVNGDNPNGGYVSFNDVDLITHGGDIGLAGNGSGVYVEHGVLNSGGGVVLLSGSGDDNGILLSYTSVTSAGGDIGFSGSSSSGAGVRIEDSQLYSQGGKLSISGHGKGGVDITYATLDSANGQLFLDGTGEFSGVYLRLSTATSAAGDIVVTGSASQLLAGSYPFGVALAGSSFTSSGGDVTINGDAPGGTGFEFWSTIDPVTSNTVNSSITTTSGDITLSASGQRGLGLEGFTLTTVSGDITLVGTATDPNATAGVFVGSGGLSTNGGAIHITGTGGVTGVWLYGGDVVSNGGNIVVNGVGTTYGVEIWDNLVSSGAGSLRVSGEATDDFSNATGVQLRDAALASSSGEISVVGAAQYGAGVVFASTGLGSRVSTQSGAISVNSTGLTGLNVADVPLTTDTGDITLEGHALGNGFGVYVGAGGLSSNGGDITLIGSSGSMTGVWVNGGDIASHGGNITINGSSTDLAGVQINDSSFDSDGGAITVHATGSATGLILARSDIVSGAGNITLSGTGGTGGFGAGVSLDAYSSVSTSSGDILIDGASTLYHGIILNGRVTTGSGDITLRGTGYGGTGVLVIGSVATNGGDIDITGSGFSAAYGQGLGVNLRSDLVSHGGDIHIEGHTHGSDGGSGIYIGPVHVDSGGGDIVMIGRSDGTVHDWGGVDVRGALLSGGGAINLVGSAAAGPGVYLGPAAQAMSSGGDVMFDGKGLKGVWLNGSAVASAGGTVLMAGNGTSDAGLLLAAATTINAGAGLLSLRASNGGTSDAIVLQGSLTSTTAVVLAPYITSDGILLGVGNGFSLSSAELATLHAPLLVIGSAQQAGAIRVTEAVAWDGNLTLQNQGGNGGISIEAALGVGDHTLALASGGDITQLAAGALTARSLLAIAGGNVSLTAASNNVAANSIAGTAGGSFAYEDMNDLAIGAVSASGFSSAGQGSLVGLSATGINAVGSVLMQTASGDLTLAANVAGSSIDLVAADIFHNAGGVTLTASNGWRIWARTWEGETRGGLVGDGQFDVYGCTFGQSCNGLPSGNQFIYRENRFVQAPAAPEPVAEWLDADEPESSAADLMVATLCPVADSTNDSLQEGSVQDQLAWEWLKSRHRLRLNNCIHIERAPGCRF